VLDKPNEFAKRCKFKLDMVMAISIYRNTQLRKSLSCWHGSEEMVMAMPGTQCG